MTNRSELLMQSIRFSGPLLKWNYVCRYGDSIKQKLTEITSGHWTVFESKFLRCFLIGN